MKIRQICRNFAKNLCKCNVQQIFSQNVLSDFSISIFVYFRKRFSRKCESEKFHFSSS